MFKEKLFTIVYKKRLWTSRNISSRESELTADYISDSSRFGTICTIHKIWKTPMEACYY